MNFEEALKYLKDGEEIACEDGIDVSVYRLIDGKIMELGCKGNWIEAYTIYTDEILSNNWYIRQGSLEEYC